MRVFVTGATGFIGRHLCACLDARGDEVVALVRSPEKASSLPTGVTRFAGDLSAFRDPATELPAADAVVHLAGVVAARRLADVRELWRELARVVGRSVLVLPVPRPALYVAMLVSTAASGLLGFKNQLDAKQYQQMVAPAWVCSSEKLQRELGWRPRHNLADCLANAAAGYRAAGLLRA
jgi:nucleoside-diphosphate-sugar epimerase